MTYEELYQWSGSWGLLILVAFFVIAVIYALWPSNRSKFSQAAHLPLQDDDIPEEETKP